ncbi:hypothetical protein H6801_04480 [Candidatus Nomurabacteria bacterium]|jgi:hypothetical protein|nr:hypothetical protein [Candidatus Saccharibacteria bacterium]MCB9822588.1 hypothetical protein [Candidatus Nomurabacteria bacterium]
MVKIVSETTEQELIDRIRDVALLKNPDIRPYRCAEVAIREVNLADIKPTTLYVLSKNLEFQRNLTATLAGHDLDPLSLSGVAELEHQGNVTGLIPPIVEVDAEHGPCLIDGAHRTYIGRQAGRSIISALWIEGVDPNYPIYAYPNDWVDIVEYDSIPAVKKHYREGDYSRLYRDISALNGSAMRAI